MQITGRNVWTVGMAFHESPSTQSQIRKYGVWPYRAKW